MLLDKFHCRPNMEKEQFAHSYAERLRQRLTAIHVLPFDRQLDREQLRKDGLGLEDFELS